MIMNIYKGHIFISNASIVMYLTSIVFWAGLTFVLLQNNIAEVPELRKHLITNEFIDLIG